jgi:hypothetical protein
MQTIRKGDSGDAVKAWQRVLGVSVDGIFGGETEAATRSWQEEHELDADGIVGPATWSAAGVAAPASDGQQVPVQRTVVSMLDYASAVIAAWPELGDGDVPAKEAVAVLWAQYMIETGGKSCWNWNLGNVKKVASDGFDFMCLSGIWEGVTPAEADRLVTSGQATRDPSADHARAVGAGHVSVLFQPPHPQTRFRAYACLAGAMREHLKLLAKKRYAPVWPTVLAGDVNAFAHGLKAHGYFTASADAYAAGMRPAFDAFMHSDAYERAVGGGDSGGAA